MGRLSLIAKLMRKRGARATVTCGRCGGHGHNARGCAGATLAALELEHDQAEESAVAPAIAAEPGPGEELDFS